MLSSSLEIMIIVILISQAPVNVRWYKYDGSFSDRAQFDRERGTVRINKIINFQLQSHLNQNFSSTFVMHKSTTAAFTFARLKSDPKLFAIMSHSQLEVN